MRGWLDIMADIPDIFDEIHWTGAELLGLSDHIFYSYLDIFTSWKINQPRSLYHQSDKFPFLPNLLLIEAAINQFGLKLKLVFIKQEGGRGEGGPGCCSLYWAPPCHCIVGCSENLPWTMTLIQTTSVSLLCLPVQPYVDQWRDWNDSIALPSLHLYPGFPSSHSHLINNIRIEKLQEFYVQDWAVLISIRKTKCKIFETSSRLAGTL